MSASHRTRIENVVPDLSGYEASIRGLRAEQSRLSSRLDESNLYVSGLVSSMADIRSDVDTCRRDNQALGRSLRETQSVVSALGAEQVSLREDQQRLARGLGQANQSISQLERDQRVIHTELNQVRGEIADLERGQSALRSDMYQQREEINAELSCLRDYQGFLTGELEGCKTAITGLNQVTEQLQEQQTLTKRRVEEVAEHSKKVHGELREFRGIVEERHREAMEAKARGELEVSEAQKLAVESLERIDRQQAARYGFGQELTKLEGDVRQADSQSRRKDVSHTQLGAALATYWQVATSGEALWNKIAEAELAQTEREARIKHHADIVKRMVEQWKNDPFLAYYRKAELAHLQQYAEKLSADLAEFCAKAHGQELAQGTYRLELDAEKYSQEAEQKDSEFPEFIRKVKQRDRFVEAIKRGIEDTFRLSGEEVTHEQQARPADKNDRRSPLRFAVGNETQTVIAEVDLDGNCHFWWEGYPERKHAKDIDEFRKLLSQGRKLRYNVWTTPTYQGEPEYKKEPPPDIPNYIPRPRFVDRDSNDPGKVTGEESREGVRTAVTGTKTEKETQA